MFRCRWRRARSGTSAGPSLLVMYKKCASRTLGLSNRTGPTSSSSSRAGLATFLEARTGELSTGSASSVLRAEASDEVYGVICAAGLLFMLEFARDQGLRTFGDLGSGVGNLVAFAFRMCEIGHFAFRMCEIGHFAFRG